MNTVELKEHPRLKRIVSAAGGYKFKAHLPAPNATVELSGTYWDEGTRYDYHLIHLQSLVARALPHYGPPGLFGPIETPKQTLIPGTVVVRLGVSRGKSTIPVIYFHPADFPEEFKCDSDASASVD